ncbi:unnamed protein product [Amaranthus hypochondriacus]
MISIQVIAETTRFKFMEMTIFSQAGTNPLTAELEIFQKNWNTISQRIHKLVKNITLGNIVYTTVAALKEKIVVLKGA